ncbi:radical SAM/SPASM domain-containing protein [Streptomyces buecherae]|uniref:radical SAM/SPASM domain-containing protein n=1 Tax=Streptomyces buecherae TaxID=2763006 RepID=UPI001E33B8A7|nr:radical SAM/SPASM domain-containing protein [Streptomyces buecherae]
MTAIIEGPAISQTTRPTKFLWLDLTRRCQLNCVHCYNSSGANGSHGEMSREDWLGVLEQAVAGGVQRVQLIGGEPMLHPDALVLADQALTRGLAVEVYSNLVHVSDAWWTQLQREGASLATSWYSDRADEHQAITGRPSFQRTRDNIVKAVRLGIPLRAGIVAVTEGQRVEQAKRDLAELGVTRVGVDHERPYGRGAQNRAPDVSGLCGQCGNGKAAIDPNGNVSPCVFSAEWMSVGNVRTAGLADILGGPKMADARLRIRHAVRGGKLCDPDRCDPGCDPNEECRPGYPGSACHPRN